MLCGDKQERKEEEEAKSDRVCKEFLTEVKEGIILQCKEKEVDTPYTVDKESIHSNPE